MRKVYLMNSAVLTVDGVYSLASVAAVDARSVFRGYLGASNVYEVVSAVG